MVLHHIPDYAVDLHSALPAVLAHDKLIQTSLYLYIGFHVDSVKGFWELTLRDLESRRLAREFARKGLHISLKQGGKIIEDLNVVCRPAELPRESWETVMGLTRFLIQHGRAYQPQALELLHFAEHRVDTVTRRLKRPKDMPIIFYFEGDCGPAKRSF